MELNDEAEVLRQQVDELALGPATIEDWRLADARLFAALIEARTQIAELRREMCQLVKSSKPNWSWFETHARTREIVEILDDLCVLRMCVASRIYELQAAAQQDQLAG